jgi:carbonic anhydrase/acetyltransferase-like protein (isoleucine patch superfamily)
MTLRSLGGKSPQVHPTAFVSEAAYVVGDVVIGPRSSVWPGAVIRADSGRITIGEGSNVQDNAVLHADADAWIGDSVTIGHGVVCHARRVGNWSLIGNGAVLNDGVELGENCLIAAGSTVTDNTVFPPRSLVRGTPGKAIGTIRERHEELQRRAAEGYVKRIERYRAEGVLESR